MIGLEEAIRAFQGIRPRPLPHRLHRDRRPRARAQALLRESFPNVTSLGMEAEGYLDGPRLQKKSFEQGNHT